MSAGEGESSSAVSVSQVPFLCRVEGNASVCEVVTSLMGNVTRIAEENSLKMLHGSYHLIWTPAVVFRVTSIVVVMVLTLIGNTTLVAIITCHRKLRRRRVNIFLVNLAIGDLMVCFVTMTTEILFVAFGEWVLGAAACKLIVYGQIVTLASATFLLTGMSIDRYQVIVQPLRSLTGQPKIWRKVLVAWLAAFVFATPQLFIFVQTDEGIRPDGSIKHMCKSKGYTSQWQRKLYFSFLTGYILVIPTAIMSFCYINIIRVVWMRTDANDESKKPKFRFVTSFRRTTGSYYGAGAGRDTNDRLGHGNVTRNSLRLPKKLVSNSKRNVIKMTLSVIIGFLVCMTPYFVVGLIRIYSNYSIQMDTILSVVEIMTLFHSAMNPILYGMFSTKAARRVLSQICCRSRAAGFTDTSTVSEDETGTMDETSWADGRLHRIHMANLNGNASGSRMGGPRTIIPNRMARVFAFVMKGRKRKRRRPSERNKEKSIPLLIYKRLHPNRNQANNPTNSGTQDATTTTCYSSFRSNDLSSDSDNSRSPKRAIPTSSCTRGQYQPVRSQPPPPPPLHTEGSEGESSDGSHRQGDTCALPGTPIEDGGNTADNVKEIRRF